ncbi:hypothetical protein [Nitrosovibrio sp. Nv6]|uniref:hypothetical protein n=1 Tax=Nitrosovibrio sp. Nv6 TaxID=1855340 RepID=UPI000B8785C2|nr:hypothetical protein [Nitrosovibrio sp. Nv6]
MESDWVLRDAVHPMSKEDSQKLDEHLRSRNAGSNLNLPPNVEDQRVPLSFTPLCDAPFGKIVRYYVDLDYFAPRSLMEIARIMSIRDPLIVGDNQFIAIINERV